MSDTASLLTCDAQEFILLSDILGLSLLVDSIDHPKPPASTEGTVLGPFHSHEAQDEPNGAQIAHDPDGEPCLVLCTIKDTEGKPVEDVKIDIWETDSKGFYDVQYPGREGPDQRAVMKSDKEGVFWFKAIVPVPVSHFSKVQRKSLIRFSPLEVSYPSRRACGQASQRFEETLLQTKSHALHVREVGVRSFDNVSVHTSRHSNSQD